MSLEMKLIKREKRIERMKLMNDASDFGLGMEVTAIRHWQ